jgi:hypothetical protein
MAASPDDQYKSIQRALLYEAPYPLHQQTWSLKEVYHWASQAIIKTIFGIFTSHKIDHLQY